MDEFKYGDEVEVWEYINEDGKLLTHKAKFLCIDKFAKDSHKYIAHCDLEERATPWPNCRHARPDLKVDDPVWGRELTFNKILPYHFAGWDENNKMLVWLQGKTSHSEQNGYKTSLCEYHLNPPYNI